LTCLYISSISLPPLNGLFLLHFFVPFGIVVCISAPRVGIEGVIVREGVELFMGVLGVTEGVGVCAVGVAELGGKEWVMVVGVEMGVGVGVEGLDRDELLGLGVVGVEEAFLCLLEVIASDLVAATNARRSSCAETKLQ
jgi:hypothetical protein